MGVWLRKPFSSSSVEDNAILRPSCPGADVIFVSHACPIRVLFLLVSDKVGVEIIRNSVKPDAGLDLQESASMEL